MSVEKDIDDSNAEPAKGGVSKEDMQELVSTFKEGIKEIASRPINVNVPLESTKVDVEGDKRKQEEEYKKVREQANEMASSGDTAGAMELLYSYAQKSQPRIDPENDPGVRSLSNMAKRLVREKHPQMFEKYGKEIEEYVKSLPPESRIDPDAWDNAIGTIRTRHFDEILEEEIEQRKKKEQDALREDIITPVQRGGGPRREVSSDIGDLTPDELGVAKSLKLTPQKYAEQKKKIASSRRRDYYPLLDEPDLEDLKIEPGKF